MPANKDFDRKSPKKKFEGEQGSPVENYPYEGPFPPRFEPERIPGSTDETEVGLAPQTAPSVALMPSSYSEPQQVALPLNTAPNQRSYPFYRRRAQSVTALAEATLVLIKTQGAGTYYIKKIGHSYYDNSVEFRLVYDGNVWYRWNFQIGGVGANSLYELECALPARTEVRLIVVNLAAQTRLYEAVVDGWFAETAGVSEEKGGFS